MNILDLPDDILEKFQVPSGINKKFEEIFNKIIKINNNKIILLINDFQLCNNILYTGIFLKSFYYKEYFDIRWWNLNKTNMWYFYLPPNIKIIPESFGNIKIGGSLELFNFDNKIRILPDSFGNIEIGGDLNLSHNQFTSLPLNFGNIKVGGNLNLSFNRLTELPPNFGNITVGGDLSFKYNKLVYLPDSFINIKVGGNLILTYNCIKILPENIGDINVGKNIYIYHNKIVKLPDSFEKFKEKLKYNEIFYPSKNLSFL